MDPGTEFNYLERSLNYLSLVRSSETQLKFIQLDPWITIFDMVSLNLILDQNLGVTLTLKGTGPLVNPPWAWREGGPWSPGEKKNLCNRFVKNKKFSIRAKDSPRHLLKTRILYQEIYDAKKANQDFVKYLSFKLNSETLTRKL